MGGHIFYKCLELSEVYLPSDLEVIPEYSFAYTQSLKSITLHGSITDIGEYAFYSSGLEKISTPESCKTIKEYAFAKCTNLSEIVFAEGLEKIEEFAFSNTALKNVILPKGLRSLGREVFYIDGVYSNSIIETIYIPDGIDEGFWCPVESSSRALTHIYFQGDSTKWQKYVQESYDNYWYFDEDIGELEDTGWYDFDCVYFYSKEKPKAPGKYWHYVDGKITVWTYEE